ncbi:GerD family protein, partial [Klebsiella pneumoniae]
MELIKDPTYQKSMEDMLKSPEMQKMMLELTQSADYRKQTMSVMQEAMQNPLFRMEVMTLLQSVVKEELQPKQSKGAGGAQG